MTALLGGLSLLVTMLSADAAYADNVAPESTLDLAISESLPVDLGCVKSLYVPDDIDFYDRMTGFDCDFGDGAFLLRIYEHPESVSQVLVDWIPVLTATNQIVVGKNWFAIGRPPALERLTNFLGLVGVDPSRSFTPTPEPLTKLQFSTGLCGTMIADIIGRSIFHPDEYLQLIDGYEEAYPGATLMVSLVAPHLRDKPGLTEESYRNRILYFGALIKSYCAVTVASRKSV